MHSDAIIELVSGYRAWVDSEAIALEPTAEAPAATTTFCAFTLSYMFTRATVQDGC